MNGFAMKNTKTQAKQTAAGCYAERFAEAQDLLKRIGSRLKEHRDRQAQEPIHWGYAGDLGSINQELAYILAALGDRSAVDAKGLDY
jgi:uncharacterized protein (UPF0128 family)